MGCGWAKVSVVVIGLTVLGGCCANDDDEDAQRKQCNLLPNIGYRVTVKGTAQYTTEVTGDAVIAEMAYGQMTVTAPQQPFSATVEMEVGDLFESFSYGFLTTGSILARNTFTPADGSAVTVHEQTCWSGTPP